MLCLELNDGLEYFSFLISIALFFTIIATA